MNKKGKTSGILALSLVLVLALTACGGSSNVSILDQANTVTSFAVENVSTDQYNVAVTTFASSFAASFAEDASSSLTASFEGMSEGLTAEVDVFGAAFANAHAEADAAGTLAASVEGASDQAYEVAYAEAFAVSYGEAYSAEYDGAMQGVAAAAIDDLASSLDADIAEIAGAGLSADAASADAGSGEANVELSEGNSLANSFENALDDANSAASVEITGGSTSTNAPDTITLNTWVAVIIVLVIGGGFWLLRFNKDNA
jgi:hypothetical protein